MASKRNATAIANNNAPKLSIVNYAPENISLFVIQGNIAPSGVCSKTSEP